MGNLANERFQTGNHVRVFVAGEGRTKLLGTGKIGGPLGVGTTATFGAATGARPIHVIGNAEPQDIVDGPHTYTIRLDTLRLRTEDAADIINAERVDIEAIDRFNRNHVSVAEDCQLVDGSVTVPANAPLARNLTFQALRVS